MITALSAIFWGVITFSILVVLHEGGHFATARAFGVHVHEFMVGLPGPALRFRGKKTDYGITAIPLGGYVRIAGMEPGPEDELLGPALAIVTREHRAWVSDVARELDVELDRAAAVLVILADWNAISEVDGEENLYQSHYPPASAADPVALLDEARTQTYRGLPTWKRIVVLSAGVAVNLVAAVLVFVLLFTLVGVWVSSLKIDSTLPGSGAAVAGLKAGDVVKSIGGTPVKDWDALVAAVQTHKPGETIAVVVVRDGAEKTVRVTLKDGGGGTAQLGIRPAAEQRRMGLVEATTTSLGYIGMVFKAIMGFFNPSSFKESVSQSSSIIGVSVIVSEQVKLGALNYAFIVAVLSLSLGLVNILPIPPLDGGKVAIELVQRIVGRPLSRNFSLGLSAAGTLLLFAFIGYLMYADVLKYVVNGG